MEILSFSKVENIGDKLCTFSSTQLCCSVEQVLQLLQKAVEVIH